MPVILSIHLSTEQKPTSIDKRNKNVVHLIGTVFLAVRICNICFLQQLYLA